MLPLLIISLSSLLLGPADAEVCAGCVEDAEVNQDVVKFAMTQLSLGDCQKSNIKVENFKSQATSYSYFCAGNCNHQQ